MLVNVAKYLEMEVSTILSVGAAFASPADRGTESLGSRGLNKWHQPSENTYRKRHMNPWYSLGFGYLTVYIYARCSFQSSSATSCTLYNLLWYVYQHFLESDLVCGGTV